MTSWKDSQSWRIGCCISDRSPCNHPFAGCSHAGPVLMIRQPIVSPREIIGRVVGNDRACLNRLFYSQIIPQYPIKVRSTKNRLTSISSANSLIIFRLRAGSILKREAYLDKNLSLSILICAAPVLISTTAIHAAKYHRILFHFQSLHLLSYKQGPSA